MNKHLLCIVLLFFIFLCNAKKHQETGKTFVGNGQIPFSSLTPELVSNFRIERTYARKGVNGGMVQGVLFGGKSLYNFRVSRFVYSVVLMNF